MERSEGQRHQRILLTDFNESLKKNGENLAPYVDGRMAHRGTGITGNRFPAASALKFVRAGKWL